MAVVALARGKEPLDITGRLFGLSAFSPYPSVRCAVHILAAIYTRELRPGNYCTVVTAVRLSGYPPYPASAALRILSRRNVLSKGVGGIYGVNPAREWNHPEERE